MKIKTIIIGALVTLLIGGGAFLLLSDTTDKSKLPDEIYRLYDCDRITFDFRETDKYCADPELWWDTKAEMYGY